MEKKKKAFQKAIQENNVAAFIFEPLVLGAAGMVMYAPEILDELINIAKNNEVFTIADEVMTGFGKTGKTFACNYLTVQPDMMCMSKALTGGTIPMAITSFTNEIFNGFKSENKNHAFFHGHTFTANPTGCAAALASIELLQQDATTININQIHQSHIQFQQKIQCHQKVKTTRVLGVIFALEVKTEGVTEYYGSLRNKLYNFFIENGIILRPVGGTIYILPPYVITEAQLQKVYQTIESALEII
jgi:adenosylmethionine---8-amino-7-oxononanoate aminotransferase